MKQAHHLLQDFITVEAVFDDDIDLDEVLDGTYKPSGGFAYTYKASKEMGLAVGDLALVYAQHRLTVVAIKAVHEIPKIDPNANFDYKWIIQKVDFTAYKHNKAQDELHKQLIDRLNYVEQQNTLSERIEKAAQKDGLLKELYLKIKG